MNDIARCAEVALRVHAHPALRLSELIEIVAEKIDRGLTPARLRVILEDHPTRFRILEPWHGPWRPRGPAVQEATEEAWVVGVGDPGDHAETPQIALRLRESVRWLGRGMDGRSRMEVSRWYAIVLAERATREAVARRAA